MASNYNFRATRTKKKNKETEEKRRLHPEEAQTKTQKQRMVVQHGGAPLVAERGVGLFTWPTYLSAQGSGREQGEKVGYY